MVIIFLCKEAPLTEYEKLRARNMMRNNHRLQSMGLAALGSFLRMRSEGDEVSGVTNNDNASAITSSDYNPKEDEDNDGEEVDKTVVEKPVVKVCNSVLGFISGSALFAVSFASFVFYFILGSHNFP